MPKYRAVPKYYPAPTAAGSAGGDRFRMEESKAVTTTWAWRAFLMMALVFFGLCLVFALQHGRTFYAVAWGLIGAVWFAFSMYLWRQHTRWVRGEIG